jgi:hypothetical protein
MEHPRSILLCAGAFAGLLFTAAACAADIPLAATGEYAKIDTKLARDTIQVLTKGSAAQQDQAVAAVLKSPKDYAPPVFYVLSNVLFAKGRKDEAELWFYSGQLRARYDANRCADGSAADEVGILNDQYGSDINKYAFQDLDALQKTVTRVIAWDKATPHDYDGRWIALYSASATLASLNKGAAADAPPVSLPESRWGQIAEMTRRDYLDGFNDALAKLKARQAGKKP